MGDADVEKQAPENGPDSSPPPEPTSRLGLILKVVAAIVVLLGLTILFFWIAVNPRKMKFYVTDASFTQFSLSNDNTTLQYNLRLYVTVRNPNRRIGFHYDVVEAGAYYDGERFDSANLMSFYQPRKTTTVVDAWFSGQRRLSLDSDEVVEFNERKGNSGIYPVDVKIRFFTSIKLGTMNIGDFKVKVKCGLKVPLSGSSAAGFTTTKCDVDFNPLLVIYND
ncbi:Late embryogenesis abundant protein [Parasponia andersonii]|uniref:Late embryogenesis abundant protein n=1 Tax=Parasponia andersonii TaxID=3476 RepID=A0A2P5D9X7_PARAD|nr:Late embryogenesis abundant protein [Parasponia andersonii]